MTTDEPDHVGRILGQWRRERPELDVSPLGVIGRLRRLSDTVDAELRSLFAQAGLSDGDFDVLASLRRSGEPCALTPGELADTTMVTSSAVTKRVDRLEAQGYVTRTVSAVFAVTAVSGQFSRTSTPALRQCSTSAASRSRRGAITA